MTPLVKKEIRLVLPAGIVAAVLALPPACTRADDPFPIFLMFLGLAMLALSSIGREASLNTFSSLLAQPMEKVQIWRVKLSVLAIAFLIVFAVWRLALLFSANGDYGQFPVDPDQAEAVLIAGCFVTVATFTGGLWSALLLRQLAGAFWLTLLVPAVLAGITAGFASLDDSSYEVIAALSTLMLVYSVSGFFFARWLFFRAQDVGWTGGIISLSGWSLASPGSANSPRVRKPFFALLKKEFQLQNAALAGATIFLALHVGVIIFRHLHKFALDSTGDMITSVVWMIWLVFPLLVSCMAIAEERRIGVMDAQLCLPCTRRRQFLVKCAVTLFLGIFFGSVLPVFLEYVGGSHIISAADKLPALKDVLQMFAWLAGLALWFAVAGFFASSLARNFLQAIGYACATVVICALSLSALLNGRMVPFDRLQPHTLLTAILAGPVLFFALLWLAWLNFKTFHENWRHWRRNILGVASAFIFIAVASPAIYNRAWEIFLPVESAHGPARMSLAQPPVIKEFAWIDALVQLPDGRVWFGKQQWLENSFWQQLMNPPGFTITEPHFIPGSNWVSVVSTHIDFRLSDENGNAQAVTNPDDHIIGYLDTVAIRNDGTLWISDASHDGRWMGDHMGRYGTETNWQQVIRARAGVLLLKNDGTLWRWGTNHFDWTNWRHLWPTLHDYRPCQVGTDSDWKEIAGPDYHTLAAKPDGTVWRIWLDDKTGRDVIDQVPEFNGVNLKTLCPGGNAMSYVRPDGTLWARWTEGRKDSKQDTGFFQVGMDTNWVATSITWSRLAALKTDGTIWVWTVWGDVRYIKPGLQKPPQRLGTHSDWVAITRNDSHLVTLAADGSLWAWPDAPDWYNDSTYIKPSKRPHYAGNIFPASD